MKRELVTQPKRVTGLALLSFAVVVVLDGVVIRSTSEVVLGIALGGYGWYLQRSRNSDLPKPVPAAKSWGQFCVFTIPLLFVAYALGYFALMDRHRPTNPWSQYGRFESSFRGAPFEPKASKATENTPSHYPQVTIWNVIYQPMDRLYFRSYPRTDEDIEALRAIGYAW